jgi:hypothetical protein
LKAAAVLGVAAIAAVFCYHVSSNPMDFRVYHYGASGVFDGTRPIYGTNSGLGWPMHYRYPPLFLLLFAPLTLIPLGAAAAVWASAKVGILAGLLKALCKRPLKHAYVISFLLITPYIIEEFRYGNAQFFVLALTILALLWVRRRPVWAAAGLALAISIKVWPAFFLPILAARRDLKAAAWTCAFVVVLALLPAFYFGASENFALLGRWYEQEFQTQLSPTEIWFPSQSLRGVMMRYLTVVDYSKAPDPNYPQVHVAEFDPALVRSVWIFLAAVVYSGFLVLVRRRRETDGWLDHALGFCLIALLQPFTQKYALALLLWPAIAAAGLTGASFPRTLVYIATILALIQPLAPSAQAHRFLQVVGVDFAVTLTLAIGLAYAGIAQLGRKMDAAESK